MKVLFAFDSFKGSLSSWEAGVAAAEAVREAVPEAVCEVVPMADGGEGTVEAVVRARDGEYVTLAVSGPMGALADCSVGLFSEADGERVAVLEVASICGLPMVEGKLDPLSASSAGVGEALLQLLDKGIRRFAIGLGGSAVNDGGMGMLAALGADFRDDSGNRLSGSGGDLVHVNSASLAKLDERLAGCRIVIATDVENPLCGPEGATFVYGRQKGVTEELEQRLDAAMHSYGERIEAAATELGSAKRLTGASVAAGGQAFAADGSNDKVSNELIAVSGADVEPGSINAGALQARPGAGAAGGLGFALMAIGGEAVSGAGWIIETARLKERAERADWVVTGEGRSDRQTLYGKLPLRVSEAARQADAGCILLSGSLGDGIEELAPHFQGCFSIVKQPMELRQCMEQARPLLKLAVREQFRLLHACSNRTTK